MKKAMLICAAAQILTAAAFAQTNAAPLAAYYPKPHVTEHARYSLAFDASRKVPDWVCWKIVAAEKSADRDGLEFAKDLDVPQSPTAKAYAGSGYDLGHMCPAADMAGNASDLADTFRTSNACPQLPALNRGDWKELETELRTEARTRTVICVAGPIFSSGRSALIGSEEVAVPDAFFKVAYGGTSTVTRAWVFPNRKGNRTLSDYSVPVDVVERFTGLEFTNH